MNPRNLFAHRFDAALGPMHVAVDDEQRVALIGFELEDSAPDALAAELARAAGPGGRVTFDASACAALERALLQYLAGELVDFTLELAPRGTPFQLAVWQALRRIPYGETASYAALARRIGRPSAVRAVARANATNPIAIAIPCHRVIGADGSLTGYAAGIERKRALLQLESRIAAAQAR